MKNIKNFSDFINEGLFSSKNKDIKNIITDLKKNFKESNLIAFENDFYTYQADKEFNEYTITKLNKELTNRGNEYHIEIFKLFSVGLNNEYILKEGESLYYEIYDILEPEYIKIKENKAEIEKNYQKQKELEKKYRNYSDTKTWDNFNYKEL